MLASASPQFVYSANSVVITDMGIMLYKYMFLLTTWEVLLLSQ